MKRLVISAVCALGLSASAFAADETEMVKGDKQKSDTFQYGYSNETYSSDGKDDVVQEWYSIRSGHLTGGIDKKLQNYRLRLNANGGELLGVEKSDTLLNKFQVELGAASHKAAYSVLALELPLAKGSALYVGSINNPGGAQRFLVGPIVYWGDSNSVLLYYPKGNKSESVVNHSLVLRNRIRELGWAWIDVDASYKVVDSEDQVDGMGSYGYGAALGVWKLYGKYSVTPYYEGLLVKRTSYEVGVDASF